MKKMIKADALKLAARMRELADDIEYHVRKMPAEIEWTPDLHHAEANRLSLSLWRLSSRFR